tara:strand:+ start:26 stop:778 length:753 start_codon:yes stop_codon:yes gene_type:complete
MDEPNREAGDIRGSEDIPKNGNSIPRPRLAPMDKVCGLVLGVDGKASRQINHGDQATVGFFARRGGHVVDLAFPAKARIKADTACISEGEAYLLGGLIAALRPLKVLETGTHRGRSTKAILEALVFNGQGHIWTVDADDYQTLKHALTDREKEHITQIVGRTPGVFSEKPLSDLEGIDFAFIDGDHTYQGLMADLKYVEAHRAKRCVVLVDNSQDEQWPDVAEGMREWSEIYPAVTLETMLGMDLMILDG